MASTGTKIEDLSLSLNRLQNELQDTVSNRQRLETQFQENKIVKAEFDKLGDEAKIYKLVGPILLPQDNTEANMNVDKRLEFIEDEIKRCEAKIETTQTEIQTKSMELNALRTGVAA
ncbi:unnamed protein product [Kuraishia capsulata CBS 1993]|uniref:Prefoldin subunit 6 n=1 Tax=Kuraishia capsulata CBS 1993 TaxID=1382522 RepID=W6MV81_9ASCO|nr:uncharacterized protein KUCA_T00005810001 [Kuraishia capsulata CBS 1993]CDK29817.1 unnamed protein product [Kuraishia capsulata CBS 1993]